MEVVGEVSSREVARKEILGGLGEERSAPEPELEELGDQPALLVAEFRTVGGEGGETGGAVSVVLGVDKPTALALRIDLGVEDFLAFFEARFVGVEARELRRDFGMG